MKQYAIKCAGIFGLTLFWVAAGSRTPSIAQDLPSGAEVIEKVNARDDGQVLTRNMAIKMSDKSGKVREQMTYTYRKYYGEEKRSVIFYTKPANVKDTGFLTFDYDDPTEDDDQWLYLPALRRVRRISSSNRGDYFLGTDYTYEDMKLDTRMSATDYNWTTIGEETIGGVKCIVVEGEPVDEETAEELGYSKYVAFVDPANWMQLKIDMWDINGNPLKTVYARDVRQVQGIWTVHISYAENHKTGHSTLFTFTNIDYETPVADDMFSERALKRGVRGR